MPRPRPAGAFTDAKASREGAFSRAREGTLFLDEIANMPLAQQAKLLRVLQERAFQPLGATASEPSTARIVSATNVDVAALATDGRFRADLMYRLNTIHLDLPPLRARRDEIAGLAERFVRREAERYGLPVPVLDDGVLSRLESHEWPGNVRELEHAVQRGVLLSAGNGRVTIEHLGLRDAPASVPPPASGVGGASGGTIKDAERAAVLQALARLPEGTDWPPPRAWGSAGARSIVVSPSSGSGLRDERRGIDRARERRRRRDRVRGRGRGVARRDLPNLWRRRRRDRDRIFRRLAHHARLRAAALDRVEPSFRRSGCGAGIYTHRARVDIATGPLAELLAEVNLLARHLADESLRAKETAALLEQVVQRVDVALLAFDEPGALAWWNPAAERVLSGRLAAGVTAASLGAEDWLTGPAERAVTIPGQASSAAWELRRGVFRREGARFHFVLLASLRRVRREEERAAWQRLLRVVGHEVNNTLAPIQSMAATCATMLRDDGAPAIADVLRALEVVEQRAGSLGRFIAEYARLARLPTPVLAPIELGPHLRRVAAMEERCPVEVLGQRQELTVNADSALLEQALVNLVRNAAEAASVTRGKVLIEWHADGDEAVISIVDEGRGIENPDNLFVPLFSTKAGGSGIGLVLARNILAAHGGDVRLTNRAHASGCIARVSLPLRAPFTAADDG